MKTADISKYLEKPYSRVVIPDSESGTYTASILEFPGCVAEGASVEEAYANLEDAAESWLIAALDMGQDIPAPAVEQTYSGRVLLRLPRSLHQRCAELAGREGISLNMFIVTALAEKVGATMTRSATSLITAAGESWQTYLTSLFHYTSATKAAKVPGAISKFTVWTSLPDLGDVSLRANNLRQEWFSPLHGRSERNPTGGKKVHA